MSIPVPATGYAFMPGVTQYSGGVVALPDHHLVRIEYASPVPLDRGLRLAAEIVLALGRPADSIAAIEMRSPAPFSDEGFVTLNKQYLGLLAELAIFDGSGQNPIGRSNVCPVGAPVTEVSVQAFTFSVPGSSVRSERDYVISGSAEAPEGLGGYDGHIIAQGDVSASGLRAKATFVVEEMRRRAVSLGLGERAVATAQIYSKHEVLGLVRDLVEPALSVSNGSTFINARPPVVGLEFEMDCRDVSVSAHVNADDVNLNALRALLGVEACVSSAS